MKQKITKQISYWIGVIVVGLALGLALQFVRAWTEPTVAPPGGNVGSPINTSILEQIKGGTLGIFSSNWDKNTNQAINPDLVGLLVAGETRSDDFCLNSDNGKCLSNAGGNLNSRCICKISAEGSRHKCTISQYMNCGNGWQRTTGMHVNVGFDTGGNDSCEIWSGENYFPCTDNVSDYNLNYLYGANHTISNCESADGEVEVINGAKICKLEAVLFEGRRNSSYRCPNGWIHYGDWSETVGGKTIFACY